MLDLRNTFELKPGDTVLCRFGRVVLLDRHETTDVTGEPIVRFTSAGLHQPPNAVVVQGGRKNLWAVCTA